MAVTEDERHNRKKISKQVEETWFNGYNNPYVRHYNIYQDHLNFTGGALHFLNRRDITLTPTPC